jgi:peptidoglycan/LPS O-acetylase OafA/YrhL
MTRLLIWFLSAVGFLICIYDTRYWIYGAPYNRWISAFLYPTTKIIWALSIALVIWMCITGNGGLVNKLLSWKAFIPLSRLTYSVYLTHAWLVWIYWASKKDLVDMNNFSILSLTSGLLLMSYGLGAVFSLIFESPFLELQKNLQYCLMIDKKEIINNNNCRIVELDRNETKELYKRVDNNQNQ